jgi:hypothetical protein
MSDDNYPEEAFTTVFVDGVTSINNSTEMVKFYMGRLDASFDGDGPIKSRNVVQVVMPMTGFVATALFFEKILAGYLDRGLVSKEDVAEIRQRETSSDGAE